MIIVAVSVLRGYTKIIPRVRYAATSELRKVIPTTNVNCYIIDLRLKTVTFIITCFILDNIPSFQWRPAADGTKHIEVNSRLYWNGEFEIDLKLGNFYSDIAILKPIKSKFIFKSRGDKRRNECILKGYLRNNKNVPVTVAGCPFNDTFQVNSYFTSCILKSLLNWYDNFQYTDK